MAKRTDVTIIINLWDEISNVTLQSSWIRKYIFSGDCPNTYDLLPESWEYQAVEAGDNLIISYMAKYRTLEEIFSLAQAIHHEFDCNVSCVVWDDENNKCCGFFSNIDEEELYRKQKENARRNKNTSEQILS
jgi:hypothetical protein